MNSLFLLFFDYRCQKQYKKDIKAICKWLDISKPNRICFLPDALSKRNCRGEFHYNSNSIIIFVPDYLAKSHSFYIVEVLAHEIIHFYQNLLGIKMYSTETVEKSAEALTSSFMNDWLKHQVERGAIREYLFPVAGGEAPK